MYIQTKNYIKNDKKCALYSEKEIHLENILEDNVRSWRKTHLNVLEFSQIAVNIRSTLTFRMQTIQFNFSRLFYVGFLEVLSIFQQVLKPSERIFDKNSGVYPWKSWENDGIWTKYGIWKNVLNQASIPTWPV